MMNYISAQESAAGLVALRKAWDGAGEDPESLFRAGLAIVVNYFPLQVVPFIRMGNMLRKLLDSEVGEYERPYVRADDLADLLRNKDPLRIEAVAALAGLVRHPETDTFRSERNCGLLVRVDLSDEYD